MILVGYALQFNTLTLIVPSSIRRTAVHGRHVHNDTVFGTNHGTYYSNLWHQSR